MINLKLAISGHRPYKMSPVAALQVKRDLRERLEIAAENFNLTLLTGMALGVDQWGALIASQLKIPFEAFLPFEGFCDRWSQEEQNHYGFLLAKASKVHICSIEQTKFAFIKRNQILVDNCNELLAYLLPTEVSSGTAQTINYAKAQFKPVKVIGL